MNDDALNKIAQLEAKIDAIWVSVEKTRKYFQITLWITVALVVLPLLALVFAVPALMSSYTSTLGGGAEMQLLQEL